jgi:hypothetical protein
MLEEKIKGLDLSKGSDKENKGERGKEKEEKRKRKGERKIIHTTYQASLPTLRPSPQIDTQGDPAVGHLQPTSIWQDPLHPSESLLFPSSHASPALRSLSPQSMGARLQAAPEVGQVKPVSTVQTELQPSPLTVLPSSHCSVPALFPSPPEKD